MTCKPYVFRDNSNDRPLYWPHCPHCSWTGEPAEAQGPSVDWKSLQVAFLRAKAHRENNDTLGEVSK